MGRRRQYPQLLALGAAVLSACAPRTDTAASIPGVIGAPAGAVESTERVDTVSVDSAAGNRVRGLEATLAAQDHQIAAVRGELESARQVASSQPPAGSPAANEAVAPAAPVSAPAAESVQAAPASPSPPQPAGAARVVPAAPDVSTAPAGPPARPSAPGGAAAVAAPPPDPRLAEAQRRIKRLERLLAAEIKRRQEVEAEMNRLLDETSAGPYEQAGSVVEQHLREQLDRAKREVASLRQSLTSERRARDDVERRFAELQAQLQAAAKAGDAPAAGVSEEELAALKARQRRVLAEIQQELAASKQREGELRETLTRLQGGDGATLAETISELRGENSALQLRLDEEHRRNSELAAKLQFAQRVTDLIFRMQASGAQPAAATALPAVP